MRTLTLCMVALWLAPGCDVDTPRIEILVGQAVHVELTVPADAAADVAVQYPPLETVDGYIDYQEKQADNREAILRVESCWLHVTGIETLPADPADAEDTLDGTTRFTAELDKATSQTSPDYAQLVECEASSLAVGDLLRFDSTDCVLADDMVSVIEAIGRGDDDAPAVVQLRAEVARPGATVDVALTFDLHLQLELEAYD